MLDMTDDFEPADRTSKSQWSFQDFKALAVRTPREMSMKLKR